MPTTPNWDELTGGGAVGATAAPAEPGAFLTWAASWGNSPRRDLELEDLARERRRAHAADAGGDRSGGTRGAWGNAPHLRR
eukprot:gene21519-34664_t